MKTHYFALFLLIGCSGQPTVESTKDANKTTQTEKEPSMKLSDLPNGFVPTRSLDDEAEMQYADTNRQFYFVATQESNTDIDLALSDEVKTTHLPLLQRYAILRQQALQLDHPDFKPGRIIETKSGGNTMTTFSFRDQVDGLTKPVFYQFSFVQGTTGIYTLTGWCEEGKEIEFLTAYQKFTSSFIPQ